MSSASKSKKKEDKESIKLGSSARSRYPLRNVSSPPRVSRPRLANKVSEKDDKENPSKKPCVPLRSCSRGTGCSLATVSNAEKSKECVAKTGGLRNPSRNLNEGRKIGRGGDPKEKSLLRSSTSSLPSEIKGKRSVVVDPASRAPVTCIASGLQRERNHRWKLSQKNPCDASFSKGLLSERERSKAASSDCDSLREITKGEKRIESEECLKEICEGKADERQDVKRKAVIEEKEAKGSYCRKLQERVAFLEGRVNQIASDLRKAREMLDSNNVDASKDMISNMQLSISDIERGLTVSTVDECRQRDISLLKEAALLKKELEPQQSQEGTASQQNSENAAQCDSNSSRRLLNTKDLEERLFPHQKLLRNRYCAQLEASKLQSHGGNKGNNGQAEDEISGPLGQSFDEFLHQKSIRNQDIYHHRTIENSAERLKRGKLHRAVGIPSSSEKEKQGDCGALVAERSIEHETEVDKSKDLLECDETFDSDERGDQEMPICTMGEMEELPADQLHQICPKTATAGWFVSEGDSVLLAHDDGCCSFHDTANSEVKAEYKVPYNVASNVWEDCWLIRASGSDGASCKYVVAASAGNALDSGFCSWDFYTKQIVALHIEPEVRSTSSSSTSSVGFTREDASVSHLGFINVNPENRHWWYRPCGPLLVSSATGQRTIKMNDIRDGFRAMKWQAQGDIANMQYSSPLQWKNMGRLIVAENEAISLWDVNTLDPRPLNYVAFPGRKVLSLCVHNSDAESSGGIRRRLSSSEVEDNDGIFCTQDSVNVLDFRLPSGIGLKIPTFGESVQSLFNRSDSIFGGKVSARFSSEAPVRCGVEQWSIRKAKRVCSYLFPESSTHIEHASVAQVWGSSNLVMAINGNGLAIFDAYQDTIISSGVQETNTSKAIKEIVGPNDLYCPSFDFSGSRILLVSRDRPASWRYWS